MGAGEGCKSAHAGEWERRLGRHQQHWQELDARTRTPTEEGEWCQLQWRTDFSPTGDPAGRAKWLWATRPLSAVINERATPELWVDRTTRDLLTLAGAGPLPLPLVDPR